jgi:6-phosphogluconolactonase (cycloisomerase 2 family)
VYLIIGVSLILQSCSDSKKPTTAAFENYNPEIVNNQDSFEFQITDAVNVTAVVDYTWANSGTQASIDHSSTVSSGTASISIYDANNQLVYSSEFLSTSTETSSVGTAGNWRIRVSLSSADGTMNFRVQAQ